MARQQPRERVAYRVCVCVYLCRLAHELEREAVHATLDTLREVARQEAEVAARERAAREAADAERQAAAAAQAQEEAARTKALIAAYRYTTCLRFILCLFLCCIAPRLHVHA